MINAYAEALLRCDNSLGNTIMYAQTTNNDHGAIDIGLECLGCIGDAGQATCKMFADGLCTGNRAGKCMRAAMVDHAEAQAEIILATIALMARTAKSGRDLRAQLPKIEKIMAATVA